MESQSPRHPLPFFHSPEMTEIGEIDGWLELLLQCKQLEEQDVKKLCDKVISFNSGS